MSHAPNEPSAAVARISPRHQFEARITIRLKAGDRIVTTEGWARDLSESGLGAFVARGLSVGELVTLEIPLTESIQLVLPAQVSAAIGTRYGFRFTALSAEQRWQIQSAVQEKPVIPFLGQPDS